MTHTSSDGQRQASEKTLEGRDKKTITAPHLSDSRDGALLLKAAPIVVILYHSCPKFRFGKRQM